jgi:hypothetical protein
MLKLPKKLAELAKLMVNKSWRMNNLYYVSDKAGRRVRFKPNWAQQLLYDSPSPFNAVLKARQIGITTGYIIDYLDDAMYNENFTSACISHKRESIETIFKIARYAYKYVPDEIKPEISKGGGSKYELYFPKTESRIYVSLEVRSDNLQRLHVSEYGLMKNKDKYNASVDAVPIDKGRISIESTPMGLNHFYDDWNDPEWLFKKHFFPWYMHPDYKIPLEPADKIIPDENETELIEKAAKLYKVVITPEQLKWRRFKIKSKGYTSFIVENPEDDQSCFTMSGNSCMNLELVKNMILNAPNPIYKEKNVVIFEHYIKSERYVVGADVAEGVGRDYSVAAIYRVSTMTCVAQIRGHIKPSDFAHEINELCKKYQTGGRYYPLLAVERNNHGHTVLLELSEHIGYPNLWSSKDGRLGWVTDRITRPLMIDAFIDAVDNQHVTINDVETMKECLTLVDNNGKIEAIENKHDDCVIAHAIAIQMIIENRTLNIYDNIESKILI